MEVEDTIIQKDEEATPKDKDIEQPEKKEVPDDHPTKLGRRVSKMEELVGGLSSKFDTFMEKFSERETPKDEQRYEPHTYDDSDPDDRITRKVMERLREEQRQAESEGTRYSNDYKSFVTKGFDDIVDVAGEDKELHSQIVDELLQSNYKSYFKITGNPQQDAKTNYGLAMGTVLKRNRSAKKANVQGDKKHAATDVSSSSSMDAPPKKEVQLDDYASKFLGSLDPEEAKALREGLEK